MCLNASAIDTRTGIFDPQFKSLRTGCGYRSELPAIVRLSDLSSPVTVSFDELAEDNRYLRYRLIHCNSDWQPSGLSESEYIDGFNLADITEWGFSQHTLMHYVNYQLRVPNEDMMPLVSGNYLLQVFDSDEPDEVLLQTRFMVCEDKADIATGITTATMVDHHSRHQELNATVNLDGAGVENPFNDLRLVIEQNGAERHLLDKPLRAEGKHAFYEHQPQLIFAAGNEYRRFEDTNVRYPGMGVAEYMLVEPLYHVKLLTDGKRADDHYIYDEDQAGRFYPNVLFSEEPDLEADYLVTHFELQMPKLRTGEVYLEGDLAQRRLDEDSRMVYDPRREAYVKTLLLKQGLYNYRYVVGGEKDAHSIEGDYADTRNEYLLLLYHRPPGARYDRLIGTSLIK